MMAFIAACGPQVDCEKLSSKLDECAEQTYTAVAPAPSALLDDLASTSSPLAPKARKKVAAVWRQRKKELAERLAKKLSERCQRHQGRYRRAEEINECLELRDCSEFAVCFRKAVGVSDWAVFDRKADGGDVSERTESAGAESAGSPSSEEKKDG
jgi:hypothetical protein